MNTLNITIIFALAMITICMLVGSISEKSTNCGPESTISTPKSTTKSINKDIVGGIAYVVQPTAERVSQ